MADNFPLTAGSGRNAATDEVTYSGDTADVQLVRMVQTTGAEGSKTVVDLPGDATNGLDVDVTRLPALVAGSANIGDVDVLTIAAGDNNIGNVDIVTMPAVTNGGTFAVQESGAALTALQLIDDPVQVLGTDTYTEATSKGFTLGAVRRDADTSLVNTTNEFAPLQVDALGRLKVEAFSGETLPVSLASTTVTGTVAVTQSGTWDEVGINDSGNSITVDNGGTFAVQIDGAALTSLQLADDVVVVLGTATYTEATSSGNAIGAVRRDADTTLVGTTNEWGPLQMDANGRLKVEAFSGETLPVSLTSTTITGSVDTELPTAAAISAENTAAPTAPSIYNFPLLFDGTNWDRAPGTSADGALVNLGTNNDVTVTSISTGDNNIGNVDIVTMPNVTLATGTNTNEVVGDVAHDSPIGGNPVRVSGRAITADFTAVATGDTTDLIATILGKIVTKPFALPGQQWVYAAASGGIVNTTAVTIKAAGAAGVRNYITDLTVINGHATVSTEVLIRDGASGTVIHRGWAQAAGGGYSIKFGSPLRGTAATLLEAVSVTTGSAIYVNASGYEGAE